MEEQPPARGGRERCGSGARHPGRLRDSCGPPTLRAAMKIPFRQLVLVGACLALAGGCQKKEVPAGEVARDAESKLPAQERVAPPGAPVVANAEVSSAEKEAYEAWFKKYHLDLNDPKMLDADPDGDGFTNREEFLANTDPTDPNSHPPYTDPSRFLHLKEYSEARLPIALERIEGEKAHLKRTDGEGKIETVKAGDTIRGLPLKVLKIEARQDIDKNGEHVDLSQVTMEDSTTKEKFVLTGNLPAKTSATYVVLAGRDGKSFKVRHGDIFTWPAEGGSNYKVIDMSQDQVVLQQVDNKKMWTVPRTGLDAESGSSQPPKGAEK
jgi:hypothetical protein